MNGVDILDQMEPVLVNFYDVESMTDEELELLVAKMLIEVFVKFPTINADHVIANAIKTILRHQVDKDVNCL